MTPYESAAATILQEIDLRIKGLTRPELQDLAVLLSDTSMILWEFASRNAPRHLSIVKDEG